MQQKKRTVLRLKEAFKGQVVKKTVNRLGTAEFDTNRVPASEYENYCRMGFAHCFDEVEQEDADPDMVNELREAMKAPVIEVKDEYDEFDPESEDTEFDTTEEDEGSYEALAKANPELTESEAKEVKEDKLAAAPKKEHKPRKPRTPKA